MSRATRAHKASPSGGGYKGVVQKKKRLTQREKSERAKAKKWAQENGFLPPDKPRLNRKKFARETWAEFWALRRAGPVHVDILLTEAIGFMAGPDMKEVSSEQVGVLKLLKMVVEYDAFLKKLETEGRETYTYGELIDEVILPIINL